MNNSIFIIAFIFIAFTSCQKNESMWNVFLFSNFSEEVGSKFPSTEPEIIYFIPIRDCRVCVTESIEFSKEQLNNSAILFILVSQTGNKSITLHYNEAELNASNIIVDGTGIAYQQNIISSSITIYYLNKGNKNYSRVDVNPSIFKKELSNVKEVLKNNTH